MIRSILIFIFIIMLGFVVVSLAWVLPSEDGQQNKAILSCDVTMKDGTVYSVTNLLLLENTFKGSFYERYNNYSIEYLPLYYNNAIVLNLKIREIGKIVILHKSNYQDRVRLVMTDGKELEGYLEEPHNGIDHEVGGISGLITVDNYPATFELSMSNIETITFSKDKAGVVVAEVKHNDGTITYGIKAIKFNINGGDERSKGYEVKVIKIKIDNSKVEIPLTDISLIKMEGEDRDATILLRSGKALKGDISDYYDIIGKSSVLEKEVDFVTYFNQIRSIVFK